MVHNRSARRRDGARVRAWAATLLALIMLAGSLPALGESGANSFVIDLSATAQASAFAPAATSADGLTRTEGAEAPAEAQPDAETDDLIDFGGEDAAEPADDAGEMIDLGEEAAEDGPGDFDAPPSEDAAPEAEADVPDDAVETEEPDDAPVKITITAAGDTTLGGCSRNRTDSKFARVARSKGPKWFLSGVGRIFKKDDLTILNLEGPLTTARSRNKRQYYFFRGSPAYVKILTSGSVEICNVANNHSRDYGAAGLKQTASVLKKAGIGVSGYDVRYTTTVKGVKVCSLGFTKWDHSVADIKKAVRAARKKCDLLIVSMHWGWEKQFRTDAQQRSMGRAAVDAGADLVIGTHSHVYGGIERYKGKYILYSLGNFCFGGNPNPTDKRCLIFQQTFTVDSDGVVGDGGINIIPAKVSSSKKTNDYRPTLMGKAEGLRLLRAVAKVSTGFSPTNTLWMKNNYLVWSGIVSQKKLNALNARVARKRAKTAKKKAGATDKYDAAALFAEESDGSLAEDDGEATFIGDAEAADAGGADDQSAGDDAGAGDDPFDGEGEAGAADEAFEGADGADPDEPFAEDDGPGEADTSALEDFGEEPAEG